FATKEKLIDERLLKHRNQIAHGQFLIVTVADYVELHDEILAIMQDFYNQIDNAATSGTYKRQ
ncbi:MAG TPA: MAE_28990/MAE_18760 family HEPN-like nuclease, partial [Pirellulales bacterium]